MVREPLLLEGQDGEQLPSLSALVESRSQTRRGYLVRSCCAVLKGKLIQSREGECEKEAETCKRAGHCLQGTCRSCAGQAVQVGGSVGLTARTGCGHHLEAAKPRTATAGPLPGAEAVVAAPAEGGQWRRRHGAPGPCAPRRGCG